MRTVRIGNGAGFWGDNLDAPRQLAETGDLDYLTLEYLAELTLSILAHLKSRSPAAGYVTDFPTVLTSLLPALQAQPRLRIVTNAGGMNPASCARHAAKILADAGLGDTQIAAVAGDDLLPELDRYLAEGEAFRNLDDGRSLEAVRPLVASANAYLGIEGIVQALDRGARIVVTGRVADASLTVGPAVHEFGWKRDDWSRLAAASVAGHLIECGAQMTGGMFANWEPRFDLAHVGYPIAEIGDDGSLVVTKPPQTGGIVDARTVSEQLVYEIGDPRHYLTPDIDVDFSRVQLEQIGPDRVRVTGAAGREPPATYKVSLAYRDGYMASGTLVISGPNAASRGRACGEMILERIRQAGITLARTNIECLGSGDSLPGVWPRTESSEVVLRVTVHDPRKEAVERFTREFAPLVTSGPPGVTGYTGPRARPYPVNAYWPTTIERSRVKATVDVKSAADWTADGATDSHQ
ncbi:MAG TPA: acyclic terpene utilization AtuA family protein [Planctomycetaceae bacterium]|nr:acyclic terpene utilization AtuA family protein [Planctomycetaceae bacterium]